MHGVDETTTAAAAGVTTAGARSFISVRCGRCRSAIICNFAIGGQIVIPQGRPPEFR